MFHDCLGSSYPALQQPWCRCCHSRCRCGWWCVELWTFPDPLWSGWWCGTSWLLLPRWAPADTHTLTKIEHDDTLFVCSMFNISLIYPPFLLLTIPFVHSCNKAISPFELMQTHDNHKIAFPHEIPWNSCLTWHFTRRGNYRRHMVTRSIDTDIVIQIKMIFAVLNCVLY